MLDFFDLTLPVLRIVAKIEASGIKMHYVSHQGNKNREKVHSIHKGMFSRSGGDDDTPMHLF